MLLRTAVLFYYRYFCVIFVIYVYQIRCPACRECIHFVHPATLLDCVMCYELCLQFNKALPLLTEKPMSVIRFRASTATDHYASLSRPAKTTLSG